MPSSIEGKLIDAAVMSAAKLSDALDCRSVDLGSVQVIWATASHADAVLKLQSSHDGGTTWTDIASASVTLDAVGAGSKVIELPDITVPALRANYAKGSNTTGTVTARYFFKSAK